MNNTSILEFERTINNDSQEDGSSWSDVRCSVISTWFVSGVLLFLEVIGV